MDSQLLYQQDVSILEFEANVLECLTLPDSRKAVILDATYFYPTGGGQEHDTGKIGSARVVDVFKDDESHCTVHVIEGQVALGRIRASIDRERRLRHMQHHTAQHLLTQSILRQTGFETVSANINGYTPSTLDIIASQVSKTDLDQAEMVANQVIYEDRAVKTYFVSPADLASVPLRRPPKVTENIRIVEIDGYDYSPCGGTHVLSTGSIGLLKVLKAERQNDRMRVYFVAGLQALDMVREMYDTFVGMASRMSTAWQEIPEIVSRQAEQLSVLQKVNQALRQAGVINEARDLVDSAEDQGDYKRIRAGFENRPVSELRMLGEVLKTMGNVVAYLAAYDGQKISLIVTCGSATGKDARQLLIMELAKIGGRGGGEAHLAQGGGTATPEQFSSFLENVSLQ
jgi:alanyl-tRNA synthetase